MFPVPFNYCSLIVSSFLEFNLLTNSILSIQNFPIHPFYFSIYILLSTNLQIYKSTNLPIYKSTNLQTSANSSFWIKNCFVSFPVFSLKWFNFSTTLFYCLGLGLKCYSDVLGKHWTQCEEKKGFRTCFTKYDFSKLITLLTKYVILTYNKYVVSV